jgi:hypothetical protein
LPAPNPTRLFHITAIGNLPGICNVAALLSKSIGSLVGVNYQNIAHAGAQGTRATRPVPNPPGGNIHDYVPFYFAPRSPMLMAIDRGKVQGCTLRQGDIVHFETTVSNVAALKKPVVFYDRNATLAYSTAYTNLNELESAVAWDLLTEAPQLDGFCKYWQNRNDNARYVDRMERRQAEFLVKDMVPFASFTRVGVLDAVRKRQVEAIFHSAKVSLPVVAMPDWYF